jgi:DNA-binding transcriptional regulator YbjK
VSEVSRRAALADAAIVTLAREGSRGLTHRATDRAAGLPEGSTSYYFRTRLSLLQAIVSRLAEQDADAIPTLPAGNGREFADAFTAVLQQLLTQGRTRLLARYELTLEATRRPELRDVLAASSATIYDLVAERFSALGVPASHERAGDFLAAVDGVLFTQVTGVGGQGPLSAAGLRQLVGRLLETVGVEDSGATMTA